MKDNDIETSHVAIAPKVGAVALSFIAKNSEDRHLFEANGWLFATESKQIKLLAQENCVSLLRQPSSSSPKELVLIHRTMRKPCGAAAKANDYDDLDSHLLAAQFAALSMHNEK